MLKCAATMAWRRLAMLRSTVGNSGCNTLLLVRWTHCIAQPSRLDSVLGNTVISPQFVLPESERRSYTNGFGFPCLSFGGESMELMAVPRKKVSRHKRGIRNGPSTKTCACDHPLQWREGNTQQTEWYKQLIKFKTMVCQTVGDRLKSGFEIFNVELTRFVQEFKLQVSCRNKVQMTNSMSYEQNILIKVVLYYASSINEV